MKNSVVESLRKANIMVSYFLRSDKIDSEGVKIDENSDREEVEMIS